MANLIDRIFKPRYTISELLSIDQGRQARAASCRVSLVNTFYSIKEETMMDKIRSFLNKSPRRQVFYITFKFQVKSDLSNKVQIVLKNEVNDCYENVILMREVLEDNFKENQTLGGNSYPSFYVKSTAGNYYLSNSGNTGSIVNTKNSTDDYNVWAIGYQGSMTNKNGTYYVTGLYNIGCSRMLVYYSSDWRCYASASWNNVGDHVVQIYKMQTASCGSATPSATGDASLNGSIHESTTFHLPVNPRLYPIHYRTLVGLFAYKICTGKSGRSGKNSLETLETLETFYKNLHDKVDQVDQLDPQHRQNGKKLARVNRSILDVVSVHSRSIYGFRTIFR